MKVSLRDSGNFGTSGNLDAIVLILVGVIVSVNHRVKQNQVFIVNLLKKLKFGSHGDVLIYKNLNM